MSAKLSKEDVTWLLRCPAKQNNLTDKEKAIVLGVFEEQTNFDVSLIQKELKEIQFLKRVCWVKLIMFIPDYILIRCLISKIFAQAKVRATKLYWKFLFNKISLKTLKTELNHLAKEGNV